jgi:hypothetical protein
MNKQELVGRLLVEGKITNEEAITLLSQQETITVFNVPEPQVETVDYKLDKLLDAEFKNELLYPDGEYETRVKDIVDFMHKVDWCWLGEVVTADKFVQVIMDNVRNALKQLREDYKNGVAKEDLHTFSGSGGIEVSCEVNEFDDVNIDVTFVAGDWFQTISLEDLVS